VAPTFVPVTLADDPVSVVAAARLSLAAPANELTCSVTAPCEL
jgi:hypothetical protein